MTQAEICKIILDEGDLQISDKERSVNLENMLKDIATTIAAKCVNPSSNRPYPVTVIEKVTNTRVVFFLSVLSLSLPRRVDPF
jgi:ribosome maturation protein Sdo1